MDFYFADGRCVPPDNPESNYFLAEETLFRPAGISLEQVRRMEGEREDRARELEAAGATMFQIHQELQIPVLNQGNYGYCWGHSTVGCIHTARAKAGRFSSTARGRRPTCARTASS